MGPAPPLPQLLHVGHGPPPALLRLGAGDVEVHGGRGHLSIVGVDRALQARHAVLVVLKQKSNLSFPRKKIKCVIST